MTAAEAKKEIHAMGPRIQKAARKGPREMMRETALLAPRLRQLRWHLEKGDRALVDRILAAVDEGGF